MTGAPVLAPVLDGIPFLRAGREALAAEALALQERGDEEGALVLLLADQDDWWTGPRAEPAALRELVRRRDALSLREAMALLSWGPVADYFAHRWSDPTFLAGLALTEAHCPAPATVFELACGIGHHLRWHAARGARVAGADVVFAKLWVARHWVVPGASLFCLDAAQPWPELGRFELVACHDAFYFLEPKAPILEKLRALGGTLALSHIHNRDWPNLSAGSAMAAAEVAAMFPAAQAYDDAELTRALAEGRAPVPQPVAALAGVEAFSLVEGAGPPRAVHGLPAPGTPLRRNPLYGADGALAWPSPRYEREYGPRATYPPRSDAPARAALAPATEAQARRRELLDLPERW
ncbi:hypothetical protein ACI6QG_05240 [Roseococcus sp. DSY-14]|uniref:hypothetical protein n=1 Tax=Roseococcus sp. DSY-14 TaxID=3369650 RepID=UPI00387B6D1C